MSNGQIADPDERWPVDNNNALLSQLPPATRVLDVVEADPADSDDGFKKQNACDSDEDPDRILMYWVFGGRRLWRKRRIGEEDSGHVGGARRRTVGRLKNECEWME